MTTKLASFPEHEKTVLIRPEHLNHVTTLFGGWMMLWADDMAYNAASLAFPFANFVTRRFEPFDFTAPAGKGDIIKVFSQVVKVGNTSCVVAVRGIKAASGQPIFSTRSVMVNVGPDGTKQSLPAPVQPSITPLS